MTSTNWIHRVILSCLKLLPISIFFINPLGPNHHSLLTPSLIPLTIVSWSLVESYMPLTNCLTIGKKMSANVDVGGYKSLEPV